MTPNKTKGVFYMNTKDELQWLLNLIEEITAHYARLSEELPELRIAVDNARGGGNSEVKKMRPRGLFLSRA